MAVALKQEYNPVNVIPLMVDRHITAFCSSEESVTIQKTKAIFNSLKKLLNGNYEKYTFNEDVIGIFANASVTDDEFHRTLSVLNEKQDGRKENGVFNTPSDITEFIATNCFARFVIADKTLYSTFANWQDTVCFDILYKSVVSKTVLDPTCGSGEFLMRVFNAKLDVLRLTNQLEPKMVLLALATVFGNDIDISAIEICKVRLFFETAKYVGIELYERIVDVLNANLTNYDFVNTTAKKFPKKYDIVIGNPPYVEDRISAIAPNDKFGNIYANVLKNSIDSLKSNGVIGFIVPISYAATARMSEIRKYIETHTAEQFVLNYADRPSCLFTKVHQKLSIVIARKGNGKHTVHTSGYKHWYKEERETVFADIQIIENPYTSHGYYPKLATPLEVSVFSKIHTETTIDGLLNSMCGNDTLYLNMRGCFWIKSFSFKQESSEFKPFGCDTATKWIYLALLNSSLFYFHWIAVSDCWHITAKELGTFRLPEIDETFCKLLSELAHELENKLEKTKVAVHTKQTAYEYKHKLCKDIIDQIDDVLAKIYALTNDECEYIKGYCAKYRQSLGTNANESN